MRIHIWPALVCGWVLVAMAGQTALAQRPADALSGAVTQADAIDVIDGHEHCGFVGHHPKMVKTASCPENRFGFDALNDAEAMIWVNDLVTNLECHASPTAAR